MGAVRGNFNWLLAMDWRPHDNRFGRFLDLWEAAQVHAIARRGHFDMTSHHHGVCMDEANAHIDQALAHLEDSTNG